MEGPSKPYTYPTQTAWLPNTNPMQIAHKPEGKRNANGMETFYDA